MPVSKVNWGVPVTVTTSLKVTVMAITSPTFNVLESLVLEETAVTVGPVVSIVICRAEEVAELPAESVSVIVISQMPSTKVPRVQLPAETAQVTLVCPLLAAVISPDPTNEPTEEIVGVLSEVKLSEVLPVSDAV